MNGTTFDACVLVVYRFCRLVGTGDSALYVGNLPLGGTMPDSIGALTGLTNLNFGGTGITGTIPSTIGQLTAMRCVCIVALQFDPR